MKQTFVFLTCIWVTLCGFNFEAVAADLNATYIEKCQRECSHCHAPIKCNENQIKCGEMPPKDYPDCLPDEICVPMDCFCPSLGDDGEQCPLRCPTTCADDEILCPGEKDSNGCQLDDFCYARKKGPSGELCPGHCPVTCDTHDIRCSVPDDEVSGCENAPVCVQKQKDINGKNCMFQPCPRFCLVTETLCKGRMLAWGCIEEDACVLNEISTTGEVCRGVCPVTCNEDELTCKGQKDCDTGCMASDVCVAKAKDINGDYCPDDSSSHGCPVECCNLDISSEDNPPDSIPCVVEGPLLGCEGKIECFPRTYGNGTACPSESVCPMICNANEQLCPSYGVDENGCKLPDFCILQERDADGKLCPVHCPPTCQDDEILCIGHISNRKNPGCKEEDICVKRQRKLWGDDKGSLCPGICPLQGCAHEEVMCNGQVDPCDGCPKESFCLQKHKNYNGEFCPDESDSHHCPKECYTETGSDSDSSTHHLALCRFEEDDGGCKPEPRCFIRQKDSQGHYCSTESTCPVECSADKIMCSDGFDRRGCRRPDKCIQRHKDNNGDFCDMQCPLTCTESQIWCPGTIMGNGCQGHDQCIDIESFGIRINDGEPCPSFCPIVCSDGKILIENQDDGNGCIKPPSCSDGTFGLNDADLKVPSKLVAITQVTAAPSKTGKAAVVNHATFKAKEETVAPPVKSVTKSKTYQELSLDDLLALQGAATVTTPKSNDNVETVTKTKTYQELSLEDLLALQGLQSTLIPSISDRFIMETTTTCSKLYKHILKVALISFLFYCLLNCIFDLMYLYKILVFIMKRL